MSKLIDGKGMDSRTQEYLDFEDFIFKSRDRGLVSEDELKEVMLVCAKLVSTAGSEWTDNDPSSPAIAAQATHLMKQKLLEIRPDLADEIRNLKTPRTR